MPCRFVTVIGLIDPGVRGVGEGAVLGEHEVFGLAARLGVPFVLTLQGIRAGHSPSSE